MALPLCAHSLLDVPIGAPHSVLLLQFLPLAPYLGGVPPQVPGVLRTQHSAWHTSDAGYICLLNESLSLGQAGNAQ